MVFYSGHKKNKKKIRPDLQMHANRPRISAICALTSGRRGGILVTTNMC